MRIFFPALPALPPFPEDRQGLFKVLSFPSLALPIPPRLPVFPLTFHSSPPPTAALVCLANVHLPMSRDSLPSFRWRVLRQARPSLAAPLSPLPFAITPLSGRRQGFPRLSWSASLLGSSAEFSRVASFFRLLVSPPSDPSTLKNASVRAA